jgi:hypothetical protein
VKGQRVRQISIWLISTLFVLGCVTPFLAATPAQPESSPLDSLGTVIVQTANAALTQTATFLPTSTNTALPTQVLFPTLTLAPTQTPPVLVSLTPTATPGFLIIGTDGTLVSVTPAIINSPASTSTPGGSAIATEKVDGGAVIKTPKDWECKIVEKSPVKGSVIGSGVNFDAYWTVLNTGLQAWPNYGVDFVYLSGLRSEKSRVVQDLPNTVPPGSKITLRVPLTAPKNNGVYNVIWSLKVGNTQFCAMKITFEVK